jgi:hypothetical protein
MANLQLTDIGTIDAALGPYFMNRTMFDPSKEEKWHQ